MQEYDLKDFKSYLLFERGLSENTVQGYIRDIRAFYEYIDYDIKKFVDRRRQVLQERERSNPCL